MTTIENRSQSHGLIFMVIQGRIEHAGDLFVANVPDAHVGVPGHNGLVFLIFFVRKRIAHLGTMPGVKKEEHVAILRFVNEVFSHPVEDGFAGSGFVFQNADVLRKKIETVDQQVTHCLNIVHRAVEGLPHIVSARAGAEFFSRGRQLCSAILFLSRSRRPVVVNAH